MRLQASFGLYNAAMTVSAPSRQSQSHHTPGPGLVTRSPKTVKHIIGTTKRILDTAQDDQAIQANPVASGRRRTTKRPNGKPPFKHHPLTANQVASVFDWISTTHQITVIEDGKTRTYTRAGNDIYALAVLFAAHTGVRASELQSFQIKDITLSDIPGTVGSICVVRTNQRKDRQWKQGTPKSDASTNRIVPLAPWLADEIRDYLTTVHPFAGKYPHAPLFPGRRNRHAFDWAKLPTTRMPSPQARQRPISRPTAQLRHHEAERRRALHAGIKMAGTLQLRPYPDYLRRLHQRD